MLLLQKELNVGLTKQTPKDIMTPEIFTEIKLYREMIPQKIKTPIEIQNYLNEIGKPLQNV